MTAGNGNQSALEAPRRGKPGGRWCWQDNETYDVFQPIIGPHAVALYGNLSRMSRDGKISYSVRSLAKITGQSPSTVDRQLKVLEHVGMVRTYPRGGNRESACELLDLKDRIASWGSKDDQKNAIDRLTLEVKSLRLELAGKSKAKHSQQPPTSKRADSQGSPALLLTPCQRGRWRLTGDTRAIHQRDTNGVPSINTRNKVSKGPIPYPFPRVWRTRSQRPLP